MVASKRRATGLLGLAFLLSISGLTAVNAAPPPPPPSLQLSPETSTAQTGGAGILYTATLSSPVGVVTTVDFEDTADGNGDSPGAPDATCAIPAGSTACSVALAAPAVGAARTGEFYAWISPGGTGGACEADRFNPAPCASPLSEGQDEAAQPGDIQEPDKTDVSRYSFTDVPVAELDCTPDTQNAQIGSTVSVSCIFKDSSGNPVAIPAGNLDAEFLAGSPSDVDGFATPADSFVTPTPFFVSSAIPGQDVICFWWDVEADSVVGAATSNGGDCLADGGAPTQPAPQNDDKDTTDVVYINWSTGPPPPPAGSNPNAPAFSAPTCGSTLLAPALGAATTVAVSASDADAGQSVSLSATGLPTYASLASTAGNPATGTITADPSLIDFLTGLFGGATTANLTATDNGSPAKSTNCAVTMRVGLI